MILNHFQLSRRTKSKELFQRYQDNPIISAKDMDYKVNSVFNPGATLFNNQTLLLLRVEDCRGISHFTVARSDNGIDNWQIDPKPTLMPDPVNYPEELWGIEDPRITYMEELGCWLIAYTAYSELGSLVALSKTKDFKHFERIGDITTPENKDAALFPVQFDGRWVLIHRPVPGRGVHGAHIWLSYSPDLRHWGDHTILIKSRQGAWWDRTKVGLSPPPLLTDAGWLILYHGVRRTASGAIYRLGLALLDRQDPKKVIARSDEWMFGPEADYELIGDVDKVVFPCGWVCVGDEIRLYYGAADTYVCVATASVDRLVEWLHRHNSI